MLDLQFAKNLSNAAADAHCKIVRRVMVESGVGDKVEGYPKHCRAAERVLAAFTRRMDVIQVCHGECILFVDEYKDLHACPKCGRSRLDDEGKALEFHVLPLEDWLKTIHGNEETAFLGEWLTDAMERCSRTGRTYELFEDVHTGRAFKELVRKLTATGVDLKDVCMWTLTYDGVAISRYCNTMYEARENNIGKINTEE